MPRTGEICQYSGQYMADCGRRHTHHFDVGEKFTPCTYCDEAVNWMWIGY